LVATKLLFTKEASLLGGKAIYNLKEKAASDGGVATKRKTRTLRATHTKKGGLISTPGGEGWLAVAKGK